MGTEDTHSDERADPSRASGCVARGVRAWRAFPQRYAGVCAGRSGARVVGARLQHHRSGSSAVTEATVAKLMRVVSEQHGERKVAFAHASCALGCLVCALLAG